MPVNRRALDWWGIACMVVSLIGLYLLMRSPHLSRLALIDFTPVEHIRSLYPATQEQPLQQSLDSDVTRAFKVLESLRPEQTLPTGRPAIADSPDSSISALTKGYVLHCYNTDIAAVEVLKRNGFNARLWDLNGSDGLGNNGHNIIEVFDSAARRWWAIDPFYVSYYIAEGFEYPLSVAEARRRMIADHQPVHLRYYSDRKLDADSLYIITEFKTLANSVALHANNDFKWRYDHRYGVLEFASALFDKLPLQVSRGLRSLLMGAGDKRWLVQDRLSPKYSVTLTRLIFFALLLLLPLGLILTFVSLIRRRNSYR
jgi:hypothetical protein